VKQIFERPSHGGPDAFFSVHRSVGRRILSKVVHPLARLRSGLTGTLVLVLSAFLLTACIVTADQSIEGNPKDPRAQDIADKIRSIDLSPRQATEVGNSGIRQQNASRPAIYLSDGSRPEGAALIERDDTGASGYDLNFENAPVATVAKVILGDVVPVVN
jgi:general secretion pathway protein D